MVSLPWTPKNSTSRSEDSEGVMCLPYVGPADGAQAISLEVRVFTHWAISPIFTGDFYKQEKYRDVSAPSAYYSPCLFFF